MKRRKGKGKMAEPQTVEVDLANPSPARVVGATMSVWVDVAELASTPEGLVLMTAAAEQYAANMDHEE